MTSALRTGRGGRRGAAVCVALVAVGVLLTGCGQEDAEEQGGLAPVVSGVVLERTDGPPAPGVDVELLVWPSPQSSSGGGSAPTAIPTDTDTTGDDGAFTLRAEASELTPHAASDGLVGIEVRVAGASPGTRTTVRLQRAEGTGRTEVVENGGLTLTVPPVGAAR